MFYRLICLIIIFAQFILICILLDIVSSWFKKKGNSKNVVFDQKRDS